MNLQDVIQATKDLSILFVEDEDTTRKYVKSILKDLFFQVDCSEDGKVALERYRDYFTQHSKYYDLVLTDIGLPSMNGLELSKHILKENPKQKIIVITAFDKKDKHEELLALGIDSFLPKPIEFEYFFEILGKNAKLLESLSKSNHI